MGLPPAGPSVWVGPIGTVTFTCNRSGPITMVQKVGEKTDLVESAEATQSVIHSEGDGTSETLNITCAEPPTPTPLPTQLSPVLPSTGEPSLHHTSAVWVIPGLLVIAALTMWPFSVRLRRR